MTNFELLSEVAKLNAQGNKAEGYKLLNEVKISSNTQLAHFAVTIFDITRENIKEFFELAKKLSTLEHDDFRVSLRIGLLQGLVSEIEEEN